VLGWKNAKGRKQIIDAEAEMGKEGMRRNVGQSDWTSLSEGNDDCRCQKWGWAEVDIIMFSCC